MIVFPAHPHGVYTVNDKKKLPLLLLLYFIVVFSPLARASWDIWACASIHIVSLLILLIYLISVLWDSERAGIRVNVKSVYFPLFIFLFISSLSYLTSIDRFNTRNELFNLLNYMFLFFMAGRIVGEETSGNSGLNSKYDLKQDRSRQYFLCLLLSIGAFLSLTGFSQFIRGVSVTGTMVNSNILAGYLVMVIPVSLGFLIKEWNSKIKRFLCLGTFGLMLVCLFLTRSLGGILGAFIGVLLVAYFMLGRDFFRKYRYYFIVLVFLLAALSIIKLCDINAANRFSWWKTALRMIADKPLFGVGLGNFGSAFLNYKSGALNSLYAHNFFLQTGAETGVAGLLVLVWFLIKVLKRGKTTDKLLFASVIGILVQNLVDYNLCIPANAVLFWMMLGIMRGRDEGGHYSRFTLELNREKKGILTAVIVMLVLWAGVKVTKPFLASRYGVFAGNSVKERHASHGDTAEEKKETKIRALGEAEDYYRKAIDTDPLNSMHYSALADVYMGYYMEDGYRSWLDEAIIELEKAVEYRYCYAPFHRNLSLLYQLKMDYERAVREIKTAIECDKFNKEYRNILENLMINQ